MSPNLYDCIIVGSGPAGVHAAYPLVEAGLRVALVDGGVLSRAESDDIHSGDFEEVRRHGARQHELFLGEELDGIAPDVGSHAASMTGGRRRHVSEHTDRLLPLKTRGIEITQTLAKGGLSEAWGAVCAPFNEDELKAVGIPPQEMRGNYQEVINRIGVSGDKEGYATQSTATLDVHATQIVERYRALPHAVSAQFAMHPPLLAMLTNPHKGRRAISYRDLEFALNDGNAIYRARFTLEELEAKENFTYIAGRVVERVESKGGICMVYARDFSGAPYQYSARAIMLAAGAVGTTRILFKSFSTKNTRLSLITKQNILMPCLDLGSIGSGGDRRRHSLCQLVIEGARGSATAGLFAQLYSYKSLLLFRLARYSPLPLPETLSLLALWAPALVLVDARFSTSQKAATSSLDAQGTLHIQAERSHDRARGVLKELKRLLLRLKLVPLTSVMPPLGASIHYAGGAPFKSAGTGTDGSQFAVDEYGQLQGHSGIYVADSASWRALPGKPPALTIMANANRIGRYVAKQLK